MSLVGVQGGGVGASQLEADEHRERPASVHRSALQVVADEQDLRAGVGVG